MEHVWRDPPEETLNLYPNMVVCDNRQTGSITVNRSRLPIWALMAHLCHGGWDNVLSGWDYIEDDYDFDAQDMSNFLYFLTNIRGEFARLLLTLANAERLETEREHEAMAPHGPIVNVTPGDPDAVQLPPSWWEDPELFAPVVEQLERCLAILKANAEELKEDIPL